MNQFYRAFGGLLAAFVLALGMPAQGMAAAAVAWPSESVYHLDAKLLDQDGTALPFASTTGRPRLVTMFYTSCQFVCPLIIDTLLKSEHELPAPDLAGLDVLMVSFDADVDTPVVLKAMADKRRLDTPRWRLAHAAAPDVRRIAAVLGIQYRQLQNHEFSHSSVLILLDAQGRIVARTERLGDPDPDFVAAIKRVVETSR